MGRNDIRVTGAVTRIRHDWLMTAADPRRIVDLNAYRQARARKALPLFESERAPLGAPVSLFRPRPVLSARAQAHRARMLAHLAGRA